MRLNIKSKFGATFLFLAALAMSGFSLSLLIADPASLSGRYSLSLFGAMLPLSILYMGRAFKKREAAPLPDPTANKVFQRSRLETLCFIICGAGFVIGAYGLTSGSIPSDSADDSWLKPSWGMYFFGACLLVFLWMLVTGGPRLILSPNGIQARFLRIPLIPWSAIRDANAGRFISQEFVALQLYEPDTYLKQMPRRFRLGSSMNSKLGVPPFSLMPDMFGTTTDDLIAEVKARIARYGTKSKETE